MLHASTIDAHFHSGKIILRPFNGNIIMFCKRPQLKQEQDFRKLPKNQQIYLLFNEGIELTSRQNRSYLIKLYKICDLFVELWYQPSENMVEQIKILTSEELSIHYRKTINNN